MPDGLPSTLGLVGVGTIGSSLIRGLLAPGGSLSTLPRVVLSPRGAAKAAELARDFPSHVVVAKSNQEVVDVADCVIIAVLFKQVEEVMKSLAFREGQKVVTLVAGLLPKRLQELSSPASDCVSAIPLPAVARRAGSTLLTPPRPWAQAVSQLVHTSLPCTKSGGNVWDLREMCFRAERSRIQEAPVHHNADGGPL